MSLKRSERSIPFVVAGWLSFLWEVPLGWLPGYSVAVWLPFIVLVDIVARETPEVRRTTNLCLLAAGSLPNVSVPGEVSGRIGSGGNSYSRVRLLKMLTSDKSGIKK